MRTPDPAVAQGLSDQLQREEREAPLRARIAELEGKLAAQREAAEYAVQYTMTVWSEKDEREVSFRDSEVDRRLNAAFADPSPSAQALTRLVEAVGEWKEKCYIEAEDEHWEGEKELADAWDALLAARSGRGEGE